ncbi:4-(cytidine 5'-diphospho)-2-C-methyl-D-erythritol kinase [Pigmentiphaga aceris]|uniref:4-diphosphocytidyl-2-C-methyl-D-erythritol kinase n=1 Tax=Pigmentiphaga aceris TaxID=1940612 RepID=A0A5C0B7Z6_9BURK|nr:4-(cytidine 5'-diphospho)-2-C-methyl-D-erythritol kinase [Pigmentiphaga aceris]QEI08927.1 4-(cytidine 5'-diphospho)-2-C-methyl-D-erythritol kinase [Pigmentiphaga aceris]
MPALHDIPAPAKLNLFLHVTGRRADGYHLLQTVFRFIDVQDRIQLERRDDGRVVRAIDLPGVPEEIDLSLRAALALQKATGTSYGVNVALEKNLPAGGGLGGGSSDAASVLVALNRLWNTGLSRQELMRIGLTLGADVPVFVFGQNAFAEGVGEDLQAVTLPERWYVVIQPNASVPTGAIFTAPDLTRDTPLITIADFSASLNLSSGGGLTGKTSAADEVGGIGSVGFQRCFGRNDLEPVVFARFEEVARVAREVDALLAAGSLSRPSAVDSTGSQCKVRMSGSGACLFTEHESEAKALAAAQQIAPKIQGVRWVQATAGLKVHPLLDWI